MDYEVVEELVQVRTVCDVDLCIYYIPIGNIQIKYNYIMAYDIVKHNAIKS